MLLVAELADQPEQPLRMRFGNLGQQPIQLGAEGAPRRLARLGMLAHLLEDEFARWTPVIKAIGLKLD